MKVAKIRVFQNICWEVGALLIILGTAYAQRAPGRCGDGICGPYEQAHPGSCPQDCGGTNAQESRMTGKCGDGICGPMEQADPALCPQDCRKNSAIQAAKSIIDVPATTGDASSPFGIHDPKVMDRPMEASMMAPGYDAALDVRQAGASWVRFSGAEGLVWDLAEKEPGTLDWRRTDQIFGEAFKNNLNLLVVINSFNKRDQSATVTGASVKARAPKNMQAYLAFLEKAVERYDGDGVDDAPGSPVVNYWEIENEVNFDAFWIDTPENYARLLKESYLVIKKANPNAKVSIAGMADLPNQSKSYSYYEAILKELDRIKDKPGDKYFDLAGVHMYNFDNTQIEKAAGHIAKVRELLNKYGYDVPIWLTETGSFSGTPGRGKSRTEKEQAADLVHIYIYSLAHGIQKVFWVTLTEWSGYGGLQNSPWDNVGLINNPQNDGDASRKLAYFTFKEMTQLLDGSDWGNIQTVQESGGVYIYKLTRSGKNIWVAWSDGQNAKEAAIERINSLQVDVYDSIPKFDSGNSVTDFNSAFGKSVMPVKDNKVTLFLGTVPLFVTEE